MDYILIMIHAGFRIRYFRVHSTVYYEFDILKKELLFKYSID